ncbi:hypothetical protein Goshw_019931, partial [Gossypium schwendimanii]|nr:hypothetical protein [Gossypium schwendimanii]
MVVPDGGTQVVISAFLV